MIATRTNILEFTRLTHFLDILNVEGDIDSATFVAHTTTLTKITMIFLLEKELLQDL